MQLQHYINGKLIKTKEANRTITNPFNHAPIASMPIASEELVNEAILHARTAFLAWSNKTGAERSVFLRKIANAMLAKKDVIAHHITISIGKPIQEARMDVDDASATYHYYAKLAESFDQDQQTITPIESGEFAAIKRHEAVGVVGLIVPWNFPTVTTAWKLAPALAAGCTVLLKPSELSPLPEQILLEIFDEIGLPKGVVNIIFGEAQVGQQIASSELIDKVSFTGSTKVGQHIMASSAQSMKNLSLELGGKSPMIICAGANITEAAQLAANGIFFNNGQTCSATSRLLIHSSISKEVLAELKSITEGLIHGDPMAEDTELGSLSCHAQFEKVCHYFDIAKQEELSCLTGGRPLQGNCVMPTVYYDVPKNSRLWREEIFGPILCTATFDSTKDAIALANDSEYGLAATVVSDNREEAITIANQLRAGSIWINTDQIVLPQLSWGGFGKSSIGRELGKSGLYSFTELKHIIVTNN